MRRHAPPPEHAASTLTIGIVVLPNAIAPIEIKRIKINEKIIIVVNDEDYPVVIGKKGMNARLLGQLIGKEIETQTMTDHQKLISIELTELGESTNPALDKPLEIPGISNLILESLISSGYDTLRKVLQASPRELLANVPGINYLDLADKILELTKKEEE